MIAKEGVVGMVLGLAIATPALSQTAVAGPEGGPQQAASQVGTPARSAAEPDSSDIVVTAQRRAESLQTVPVSVSVASGESLRQQNVRTLEDLSARVPNLRITAATLSDQIHIRGTGSGFNTGFEQSVATFVDGVYRSRSRASRVALFDIDRVEVLKGPQTTFFGANAIAGALNITTRKPSQTAEANGTALYAVDDGEYNVEGGVSGPVSDTLSIRVAGRWSGMDGYIRNDRDGSKGPHLNDKQGRISALWQPTDALTINARFDIARLRDKGTFNAELYGCPPAGSLAAGPLCARALAIAPGLDAAVDYHSGASIGGSLNLNLEEGSVGAQLDLGALTLNSITSYQHQRADNTYEVGPFPVPSPIGTPGYFPVFSGETYKQFSQELRLESDPLARFNYIAGIYYEHGKLFNLTNIGNFAAPVPVAARTVYAATQPLANYQLVWQKSNTYSAFASATYRLTDALSVTGNLRYTKVDKAAARFGNIGAVPANNIDPALFVPGPESVQAVLGAARGFDLRPFTVPSRSDDEFMPGANVKYQLSRDVLVYASYAHGFKAGGFSGGTSDVFAPETVNAYEAGIKAQWLDRRLTTNLTVFRSDYANLQEAQNIVLPSGSAIQIVTNAAKSRASGIEFSTSARATTQLTLRADVAYLDSHYVRYPNAPCSPLESIGLATCLKDRSGFRRAYSPEWSGSVSADYSAQLSTDYMLRLGGTAYFTSSYFQQPAISYLVRENSYAKLDLRAAVSTRGDRLEFAVIAKNVTDKLTVGYSNYAPAATGTAYGLPDRPRSIAFQISAKY